MHHYAATVGSSIPDNDPTGASNTIDVGDDGSVTAVKVTVDISHTYRGDLRLTLVKGDKSVTVVDGDGGSTDDIKQTFTVNGLSGATLRGGWTLKVEDTAAQDTGTLNSWSLDVTAN
jgi:subtilisin-like proprotein convertase family protein